MAKIIRLDSGKCIDRVSVQHFSNSRLVLGNFLIAEEFLKNMIRELVPKKNILTFFKSNCTTNGTYRRWIV